MKRRVKRAGMKCAGMKRKAPPAVKNPYPARPRPVESLPTCRPSTTITAGIASTPTCYRLRPAPLRLGPSIARAARPPSARCARLQLRTLLWRKVLQKAALPKAALLKDVLLKTGLRIGVLRIGVLRIEVLPPKAAKVPAVVAVAVAVVVVDARSPKSPSTAQLPLLSARAPCRRKTCPSPLHEPQRPCRIRPCRKSTRAS